MTSEAIPPAAQDRVFEATLEAEIDDYVAMFRLWQHRLEFIGAAVGIAILGFAAMAFLSRLPAVAGALALVGVALILVARTRVVDRWRAKQVMTSRVGGVYRMVIGPAGIETHANGVDVHLDWSAVDGFRASDKVVILSKGMVIRAWFPLRAFAPDDRAAVVDLVRSKLRSR